MASPLLWGARAPIALPCHLTLIPPAPGAAPNGKGDGRRNEMETRWGRTAHPSQQCHCQPSTEEGKGLDKPRQK